ncbi:MAG TPA: hypothetical protein VGP41_16700 [Candidatus Lustribacter sp.]|jgi:hypothetical protein|nr:hypothetical protein [Candidatus Lustribacter sp.]
MRPVGTPPPVVCWHCGAKIVAEEGNSEARYLYRGDAPSTVIVEDWIVCVCGAYQNVRRLNEISVEPLGNATN